MLPFLKQIIREAGELALDHFKRGVTYKAKRNFADLVTVADHAVSDHLIARIQQTYPTHHIHSEERDTDINPGAEFEWVIDPIDGTRNFALGIPSWCILIAVLQSGNAVLSAVYSPISQDLFHARAAGGAFLNDRPITVNQVSSLQRSLATIIADPERAFPVQYKKAATRFLGMSGWLHHHGSMMGACYLASGGFDFFVSNCGYDHDYLAPMLICKEAGAIVTDCFGNPWERGRADLVMASPAIHSSVIKLFHDNE